MLKQRRFNIDVASTFNRRCFNIVWLLGRLAITKTYLYNFDPFKPHFYIVKLGFAEEYIIFLFLLKNIDCGYSLELPQIELSWYTSAFTKQEICSHRLLVSNAYSWVQDRSLSDRSTISFPLERSLIFFRGLDTTDGFSNIVYKRDPVACVSFQAH